MRSITSRKAAAPLFKAGAALCLLIGLWWGIAAIIDNPLLLPTPPAVAVCLWGLLGTGAFYLSVAYSLLRVLLGLAIGVVLGIFMALFSYYSSMADALLHPLLVIIRATPVASFVMLVWCFTGSRILPVVIAALMVLPIVADNLLSGLRAADPRLLEVAALYDFSKRKQFFTCRLPSALPYLFTAVSSSVGFAWKAGIAAEILMTSAPVTSIGKNIYFAKTYMQTEEVFAWTVTVIVLSLIIEVLVKKTLLSKKGKEPNDEPAAERS